jgi:hypothetical protein
LFECYQTDLWLQAEQSDTDLVSVSPLILEALDAISLAIWVSQAEFQLPQNLKELHPSSPSSVITLAI